MRDSTTQQKDQIGEWSGISIQKRCLATESKENYSDYRGFWYTSNKKVLTVEKNSELDQIKQWGEQKDVQLKIFILKV